jgi:acyl-CoA thioesterase FadM
MTGSGSEVRYDGTRLASEGDLVCVHGAVLKQERANRHLGGAHGLAGEFVMRASSVEYHAPARFDELIEAFVRISRIGRTSVTYECAATREPDGALLATATQTIVLIDPIARRPAPVPEAFRAPVRLFEQGDLVE